MIGHGIVKSLRDSQFNINLIGASIYDDFAAKCLCDFFEKAPLTSDMAYIDWLIKIVDKYKVDLIMPGIEDDIFKLAENASMLEALGVSVLINNTDLISFCKDKWKFYSFLNDRKIPYLIESSLSDDFGYLVEKFGLPFILKPRCGSSSKGIVKVNSQNVFDKYKGEVGSRLMVQPIVGNDDEEYTTSAFCDGVGGFYAIITLKRKLSKHGYTEKAEVVEFDKINEAVLLFCKTFKPVGPTNFQFRVHGGDLKLLEINPRISSSTSIRTAFGYNETKMSVEFFLEKKIINQPVIRKGKAIRYVEDLIIYDEVVSG